MSKDRGTLAPKPGHDVENTVPLFDRMYVRRPLPQAIAAQAIAAI
jgi:hypothetical protein